jgi:predicted NACHT family NTPase
MRKRGLSETAILAALMAENVARCNPPLEESEVKAIVTSIGRYQGGEVTPSEAASKQAIAASLEMLENLHKTIDRSIYTPPPEMIGGMFPRRFLSVIIAAPGTGKTWLVQRLASDLSIGGAVLDGLCESEPKNVLIFAGEAGVDTLIQRAITPA